MKALLFGIVALAVCAGGATSMIPSAYACSDGVSSAKKQPEYAWQYGYGKGGRSEWHWARTK